ncbi:MAG: exosome complex protein Rrp42 [Promethearchaeota archaeon]
MVKSEKILSEIEQSYIEKLVNNGTRIDERSLGSFRDVSIKTNIIEKANGSADVTLGNTRVVVGVKLELGTPFPDTPHQGVVTVNAELAPIASPFFESGPPTEEGIELARVVDRGIRQSNAVDTEKLCILDGEKVWIVFVDIYALDHDGNLIDASALAAISALLTAKIPKVEVTEEKEIRLLEETIPLPVVDRPVAVTLAKLNGTMIVDPCLKEEFAMNGRITFTFTADGNLCALQKGGIGTFEPSEILNAFETARNIASQLRQSLPEQP